MLRDNSRSKADIKRRPSAPAGHRASDRGSRKSSGIFVGGHDGRCRRPKPATRQAAAPLQEDGGMKVALITGAGSGMGEATARQLVKQEDCAVVITGRREEPLRALEAELG